MDCLCHRLCYRLLLGSLNSILTALLGHREALVKGKDGGNAVWGQESRPGEEVMKGELVGKGWQGKEC